MTTPDRSVRRLMLPSLVALLCLALIGCSVAPGASPTAEPPVVPTSASPPSVPAETEVPQATATKIVALPSDLQALLGEIVNLRFTDSSGFVQRLGSAPVSFEASPEDFFYPDYYPTGSYLAILEMGPDDTWLIHDVDLTTGDRRLVTTLQRDGMLAVSRDPTGAYLLAGDTGVVLIDVATGKSRQLIEPVAAPEFDIGFERYFYWSPTGRTGATKICSTDGCIVDIIDPSDWSVRRLPGTLSLQALSDTHAVFYPSLDERRPRLLDLATFESRPVAPQLAGLIGGYPRDDGGFVLYGVTSWPYEYPVHRPLVLVDPVSKTDTVLVDQGPDDWAYPFMNWTSNDWVLLTPELARGGDRPGVKIAIDTRTGTKYEFKIDAAGSAVAP